jgi:hypothetical protein
MLNLVERYHQWRRNSFYASKADIGWRHEFLVAKLEESEQKILKTLQADAGESTSLDILRTFPLFCPNSAGSYHDRARHAIQAVQQLAPFLSAFAKSVGAKKLEISSIAELPKSDADIEAANCLKYFFDMHGSDKSSFHNYHHFYGTILQDRARASAVFEVGLGTNNVDIVSNMGSQGRPGASLRAFRDYLENAMIYGADVDTRILFKENRIETYFVDQTDPASFDALEELIPSGLDLVIDDGLHCPNANIETLKFGLSKIRPGGWVVIEDIDGAALPFWEVVAALLPDRFEPALFEAELGRLFAVKRLS